MSVNFDSSGFDIATIFEPIRASAKRTDLGFIGFPCGMDIADSFMSSSLAGLPINATVTTNIQASGADIGTLFQALGYAPGTMTRTTYTSGSGTFNPTVSIPVGYTVNIVNVVCIGGGGGGGGGCISGVGISADLGGGGGGGSATKGQFVINGASLSYTVGTAGTVGVTGNPASAGGNGGTSSLGTFNAQGGHGGGGGGNSFPGGAGAGGSGGTGGTNVAGGFGGQSNGQASWVSSGGGSTTALIILTFQGNLITLGANGGIGGAFANPGGGAGYAGGNGGANGDPGISPGGGGSGGTYNGNGAAGGAGQIIIYY